MNYKSLAETIYHRLSHRRYQKEPLTDKEKELLGSAISEVRPLYPDIRTEVKLLPKSEIQTIMPWTPSDVIVLFSEEREGYLENAGFILEQLDLYIQSIGLGSCYIGLAKMAKGATIPEGLSYVITLAVGRTKVEYRTGEEDFNRKPLGWTVDIPDEKFTPMRLAPSAMNTEAWHVKTGDGVYYLYRRVLSRSRDLARMNTIDVGIALAHVFVTNPDTFTVIENATPPPVDNLVPVLTFKL